MNEAFERISNLSPKRLALLVLDLQAQLAEHERRGRDPIAIVGMGCRFPGGADTPDQFWRLLRAGVDAVTEVPAARWDMDAYYAPDANTPGKINSRFGGFLADPSQFDPQFFGISPREAASMDPQQRLLLEVAWEALEDAGYAPDRLAGSPTGVFIGLCNNDYHHLQTTGALEALDTYAATGNGGSVASGRISYILGLQGPSFTVDTACSSSLTAIHLAAQSLRTHECRTALAGGVNLILTPVTSIMLSRGNMLAPDGRCKTFDDAADGFVRAEGCGLVVLKRLSDALADGDRVLAVLRGSAANQDGRSNGLTAPNGPSQEAVIRQALANAGVEPAAVSYVETHGTGTSLGDPIEVQALNAVYGAGRSADQPLALGSVKTNIGHAEAAAGVAGLIKTVLCLQHGELPPHLHLTRPNAHLPWETFPFTIPTALTPWTPPNGRRIAAVSSFGFSGSNVHLIVEEMPPAEWQAKLNQAAPEGVERPAHLLPLSARSETALRALAQRYEAYLAAHPAAPLADAAYTAGVGRAHFERRLTVRAQDTAEAQAALQAYLAGGADERLAAGVAAGNRPQPVVFMFTGQGAQYAQMGRTLYETQPVFRRALERCAAVLRPYLDRPLLELLYPAPGASSPLDQTAYTQPALFAVAYALVELWAAWGVVPAAVMGHSAGEYAAACSAGILSLEDGLRLIAERGRLMQAAPEGEMAAVFADEAQVTAAIAPYTDRVAVAAINGPGNVVISGTHDGVTAALAELQRAGIRSRRLAISAAAHSPLMDPLLAPFERAAAQAAYAAPQVDFISALTNTVVSEAGVVNAAYWRAHLRRPVRFAAALQTLYDQGYRCFLEIGPTPTLIGMGQRCLSGTDVTWLPSLRPGQDDWTQMLDSLGRLYTHGVAVDWPGYSRGYRGRRISLPTYPFDRQSYWVTPQPRRLAAPALAHAHPLLGERLHSPALTSVVFETHLSADAPAFLQHHHIYGAAVLPSPAYIEMALAGARAALGAGWQTLENVTIREALILPEEGTVACQLLIEPAQGDRAAFQIVSRGEGNDAWTVHVTGLVCRDAAPAADAPAFAPAAAQARCPETLDAGDYYAHLAALGLVFGDSFRGIRALWRREGEAVARLELPAGLAAEAPRYAIHPAFLDACFHPLGAALPATEEDTSYLVIGIERFRFHRTPGAQVWHQCQLRPARAGSQEVYIADVRVYDETGALVAAAEGMQIKRASREALLRITHKQRMADWMYAVQWQPVPLPADAPAAPAPAAPATAADALTLAPAQADAQFGALSRQYGLDAYTETLAALNRLSVQSILWTLRRLGWQPSAGAGFTTAALRAQLAIQPPRERLLHRWLALLAEAGWVQPTADGWQAAAGLPAALAQAADPQASWAVLSAAHPEAHAEITLASQCAAQLSRVLRGEVDPLHLLFPGGSLALTEALYSDSPFTRVYNLLAQSILKTTLAGRTATQPIKALEIGAGTGATTACLLAALPADQLEYVFTDVSPMFLARAQKKFSGHANIRYALLDIEQPPAAQGFTPGGFDLVVASNVLHATADVRAALDHAAALLAPGGRLLLIEGTQPQAWVDITFGLTEGWWRFTDTARRPHYPLLDQAQWLALLSEAGLTSPAVIPNEATPTAFTGQGLFVAQTPAVQTPAVQTPAVFAPTGAPADSWLILADRTGVGAALAQALTAQGAAVQLVSQPADADASRPTVLENAVQTALAAGGAPCRGIVYLWALDAPAAPADDAALAAAQQVSSEGPLYLLQATLRWRGEAAPRLWFITQGAQPAMGAAPAPWQAPLWGLGRVAALEHPELWGGLVDLDPADDPRQAAARVLAELAQPDDDDQLAYRAGVRLAPRLIRSREGAPQPISLRSDGCYLITGGLGGLGLQIAEHLAAAGAQHLALLGRTPLPPQTAWAAIGPDHPARRQITALQALTGRGVGVTTVAADVADRTQMAALCARFGRDLPPLRGIIHAAADISDWRLAEMPADALRAMLRSKMNGAWLLDALTQGMALDFFVSFSSTTALWGARGLGHYAAANAFLDVFAHARRSRGLPALTINWGTWEVMQRASSQDRAAFAQMGLIPMPAAQALAVLDDLLGNTALAQICVAAVNWDILKPVYEARRRRPFLSQIAAQAAQAAPPSAGQPADLLRRWNAAPPEERSRLLTEDIRREAARILDIRDPETIDADQGLFDMGMDSLMSVELKSRLEVSIGRSLPSTLTFNYPTIADLAGYLQTLLPTDAPAAPAAAAPTASEADAETHDPSEDELADLLARKLQEIR